MTAPGGKLILSLFSGVGLLDEQFRKVGFCVVSAGDLITGQDIRDFKTFTGRFDGVIGGSPCQDFSGLNRSPSGYSLEMIKEFERVVLESDCDWWLLENVKGVPDLVIEGYSHQRIDINQGWYEHYSRLRHIQFGSKSGEYLDIPAGKMLPNCKPLALASDDRSFAVLRDIQGLPDNYDLPSFNVEGKKRAVGNGVPASMGSVIAQAVKNVTYRCGNSVTDRCKKNVTKPGAKPVTFCPCGCKRGLVGKQKYSGSACRKRAERKRKKTGVMG